MFLIPPSPRLRHFHVHCVLMSFMLKKLVYRRKSELNLSWGVCDFMNYFTRSFSYGLCPLVKLLLGFSWIEKGGVFLNVALFMGPQYSEQNQSIQTTKRLLCGKLQWWTLPRGGHILNIPSLLVWKFFVMDGGGEIRTCTSCCLRDIKVMKTVKQSSTNQNSCKCLREALTIWWLEEQYLERCRVVELRDLTNQPISLQA